MNKMLMNLRSSTLLLQIKGKLTFFYNLILIILSKNAKMINFSHFSSELFVEDFFYYTDAYFNQFIVYDLDTCKYEIGLRSIVYFDIHLR